MNAIFVLPTAKTCHLQIEIQELFTSIPAHRHLNPRVQLPTADGAETGVDLA